MMRALRTRTRSTDGLRGLIALSLFGAAALGPGCESEDASVAARLCTATCECYACEDGEQAACVSAFEEQLGDAESVGCASELEAHVGCALEPPVCQEGRGGVEMRLSRCEATWEAYRICRGGSCLQATEHVAVCLGTGIDPWEVIDCTPAEACVAQCALGASCDDVQRDFEGEVVESLRGCRQACAGS